MLDQQVAATLANHAVREAFARFKLLALGWTQRESSAAFGRVGWDRLAPGVYGLPGHRDSWAQRLSVADLGGGDRSAPPTKRPLPSTGSGIPRPPWRSTSHTRSTTASPGNGPPERTVRRHRGSTSTGEATTTLARTIVDLAARRALPAPRPRLRGGTPHRPPHLRQDGHSSPSFSNRAQGMTKLASILDDPVRASCRRPPSWSGCSSTCVTGSGSSRCGSLPPRTADVTGFVDAAFIEAKLILEADGRRWHDRSPTSVTTGTASRLRRALVGRRCASATKSWSLTRKMKPRSSVRPTTSAGNSSRPGAESSETIGGGFRPLLPPTRSRFGAWGGTCSSLGAEHDGGTHLQPG